MAGQLNNADGFTNGVLYHGDGYGWEDAQGRFFLRLCVQRSWTILAGVSPVTVIASEPCS